MSCLRPAVIGHYGGVKHQNIIIIPVMASITKHHRLWCCPRVSLALAGALFSPGAPVRCLAYPSFNVRVVPAPRSGGSGKLKGSVEAAHPVGIFSNLSVIAVTQPHPAKDRLSNRGEFIQVF